MSLARLERKSVHRYVREGCLTACAPGNRLCLEVAWMKEWIVFGGSVDEEMDCVWR